MLIHRSVCSWYSIYLSDLKRSGYGGTPVPRAGAACRPEKERKAGNQTRDVSETYVPLHEHRFCMLSELLGLESSRSPYSKSHERRLKRKAKEQVAGGMSDMQAAISAVDDDALAQDAQSSEDPSHGHETRPKPKAKPGQIGEGKGAPLSKSQRKRAL